MILPLILSAPTSALFSCFNQSHCRLCKFRASRKSIPRLAGWLITWCKRGSRVRKSQQSQLYSVLAPSVSPLRWILWGKKTEAHHVVIILCSVSFSFPHPHFSCYPALNGAADELGIEFMGKTTFHWLCQVLNLSVCLTSVKYCIQNTHNQHNKAAHLGKLMWASRHGNTVVAN